MTKSERQKSTKSTVNILLEEYKELLCVLKTLKSDKESIENLLLEKAEQNPSWFDSKKTAIFDNGKLRFVQTSEVKAGDDFEMTKFLKKYPHLVKVSEKLETAKIKPYLEDAKFRAQFDLALYSTEKFKVEV